MFALRVLHRQDLLAGPMKMIGDVGYLLAQAVERVASYPPSLAKSTSTSCPSAQVTVMTVVPSSLIRR